MDIQEPPPVTPLVLMIEAEAARYVSLSLSHMRFLRKQKMGPRYVKIGLRRLAYRPEDVKAWIDNRVSE